MSIINNPAATDKQEFWRSMPKIMLHEHLDGGLRPQTLWDLCQAKDLALPASDAQSLADWLASNANSGSLERYLACFGLTVAAMGDAAACEQVAYEAVLDAHAEGCLLAEFRMAPLLLEPAGLTGEAAVEALLAGLGRGALETGLPVGLIVCAMRMDTPEKVERAARLAVRYATLSSTSLGASPSVVGFDLAGAEAGFPATTHRKAIHLARDAGLGITLHAGEADEGARVLEAIALGASRIGHGVRIAIGESAAQRMAEAAIGTGREKVHFEVCPTSNVHTGAVPSLAAHPLRQMLRAGLSVSVQTDNRLISHVTMGSELQLAHDQLGISIGDLTQMAQAAAEASFLPMAARAQAAAAVQVWCTQMGL